MYKRSVVIRSPEDARSQLNFLYGEISKETLTEPIKQLVLDQISTTLLQFERQLSSPAAQSFSAERLIEGDGYRIRLAVRQGHETLGEKIRRVLGLSK